jgi:four helix bundle protein
MNHKDLDAWKRSMELVDEIYKLTRSFPDNEKFGLVNQMRRSAISVPSNIAEGAGRQHKKEMIQFLYISLGSLAELETQLLIAISQEFTSDKKVLEMVESARRPILGLTKYLKSSS